MKLKIGNAISKNYKNSYKGGKKHFTFTHSAKGQTQENAGKSFYDL